MSIEIEKRARFDQATYDQLLTILTERAEDLGANHKHLFFYVLPDKLLKVVNNLSTGTGKISLKTNKIGQGSAFPEIEMDIAQADIATAVRIFNTLGFENTMHEAINRRHDFRYQGIEIALKYSDAWGHHAEFEILLDDTATDAERAQAEERIHAAADELGVSLMTEQALAEFTAAFEAAHAAQQRTS